MLPTTTKSLTWLVRMRRIWLSMCPVLCSNCIPVTSTYPTPLTNNTTGVAASVVTCGTPTAPTSSCLTLFAPPAPLTYEVCISMHMLIPVPMPTPVLPVPPPAPPCPPVPTPMPCPMPSPIIVPPFLPPPCMIPVPIPVPSPGPVPPCPQYSRQI